MELFKTVPGYFMAIYLFSRRHLINSSDVFVIKGFTVVELKVKYLKTL